MVWIYVAIGALFLLWFFLHLRSAEHKGKAVLLSLRLFRNGTSNLGLGTQTIQWLVLQRAHSPSGPGYRGCCCSAPGWG